MITWDKHLGNVPKGLHFALKHFSFTVTTHTSLSETLLYNDTIYSVPSLSNNPVRLHIIIIIIIIIYLTANGLSPSGSGYIACT